LTLPGGAVGRAAGAEDRTERILARVRAIPRGFVRSYADIDPAAPRQVGRVLATIHAEDLPWHRVVRADGSVPMGDVQRELLRRERVPMRGDRVDLEQARFPPDPPAPAPGAPARASLPAGIAAVAAADPALAALIRTVGPIRHRPLNPDGHFGALARAIVFQQLAGPAANAIHGRFRALVPGPLDASALMALSDEDLRAAGLSKAKVASLRDLSAKVLDGTVVLGGPRVPDEEIVARLVTVRGIGRWTAEMYLMFELRRLDVWPVDDLGVRQGYGLIWGLEPPPIPTRLEPLGERFRPYRSVVARYCWEAVHLERRADPALR
jgi:DNA-3-methyladenine glycosylase II